MKAYLFNGKRNPTPGIILFLLAIITFGYIGVVLAVSPGDLDTTFGMNGVTYTPVVPNTANAAHGVVIQADGKTVVVGEANGDFGVARYCVDGSLDNGTNCGVTGFGTGGVVTTAVSANVDVAEAVVIEPDGQIVVAGYSTDSPAAGGTPVAFVVIRYDADGTLDAGFASSGIFSNDFGSTISAEARAVALQTDGKIVVAGTIDEDFAAARLTTSGGLDTAAFNSPDGYTTTDIAGGLNIDEAQGLVIQDTGKIVLGGTAEDLAGNHQDFALARYTSTGALDTTFGVGGRATVDVSQAPAQNINDLAYALGEQSDGSLVLAGYVETADATNAEDIGLARFTVDGALDTTFGTNGTTLLAHAGADWTFDMAVQPTDKIVVGGFFNSPTTNEDFQLVRFNSDGTLDTTFGTSGFVVTDIGTAVGPGNQNSQDEGFALAYGSDKIVAVGLTDAPLNPGNQNFAVARYEANNTPPTLTNVPKSGDEDVTMSFTAADFTDHFSDVNDDNLKMIKIVSLPANGLLKLSGSTILAGAEILAADLGNITFVPTANWYGNTSFSWNASDGQNYAAANATVNIAIANVNDAPSFTLIASPDQTVAEDAGAQTVAGFVTSSTAGPNEDGTQTVTFDVSNDASTLFSVQPAINGSGTLTYTPAANRFGSATVTVKANDGQAANNLSAPQTFSITITPVNDVPSFTGGGNVTVNEDAGATTVNNWATSISSGPFESDLLDFIVSVPQSALDNLLVGTPTILTSNGNLSFTPRADAFGSTTVTVTLTDGDKTTSDYTFTLTVNSVNDAPSFTKGADQTVLEDSGLKMVNGWAKNLSAGPANEASQTLHFNISTNNDPLFAAGPSIDSSGNLTFTPAANANGSATVTVAIQDSGLTANGGVDTSADQTFVINVTAVNDPPSLTLGTAPVVNEDAGPTNLTGWASNIVDGPADESGQTTGFKSYNYTNSGLFSSAPTLNLSNGNLSFTPAANAFGTSTVTFVLQDNGGVANGGNDTSGTYSFVITVNSVNDVPSFTKGADQTVLEDSGLKTVNGWATNLSAGPANEASQTLHFNISTNNDSLFAAGPTVDSSGNLTFTPAADANGSATVTIAIQDSGSTANGGVDTSADQTFVINVTAVNDPPSFTSGGDVFVDEEFAASGTTVAGWASNISAGAANESGQTLTFNVSTNNDALFAVLPTIDETSGDLTLTAKSSSGSSATITVTLSDNGGTANGGANQSAAATFVVTVTFVNDAPTFTAGANQTVAEDAGAQTVAGWATAMYAGSPTETSQVLTFNTSNNNTTLFAVQPAIDATSGDLTYTPAANANGSATVTVTLSDDGGTANGGKDTSAPQTFVITVNPVNDQPTLAAIFVSSKINNDVVFTAVDFENGFNDVDGDSLDTVRITSLPGNGVLKLGSTAVTINQEIPAASLNQLTFTPTADWTGTTSFTWMGSDGVLFAATPALANITVDFYEVFLPIVMR